MKVLFLSEWYPHRYDAMEGLFVRKHAEAVARQNADVCVLYLHKDKNISKREIVTQTTNGVKEIYVYYPFSLLSYLQALIAGWKEVKRLWGMPDICQLNVISKNSLLPLYLKKRYHIPYVIVEHWTGYLSISRTYGGLLHKQMTELAIKESSIVMPVSDDLRKAMEQCGLKHEHYHVINNVVDDFFYNRQKSLTQEKKRILHISCFDEAHKNVCGILRVIKQISNIRHDFCLAIVGVGTDYNYVRQYAESLNLLKGIIEWTGELAPIEVAKQFLKSDIFLMFSNYENAPVVISEALATGTPVISSDVGGIPEMVNKECGILLGARDEQALADAIIYMLDNYNKYKTDTIKEYGKNYTYDHVGKELIHIYEEILENYS